MKAIVPACVTVVITATRFTALDAERLRRAQIMFRTIMRQVTFCLIIWSMATTAHAALIWSFTAPFGTPVTTDTELLAGANFTATYTVDLPANYVDLFGASVASVNLALTQFEISGSGIGANNTSYAPTFPFGGTTLNLAPNAWGSNNAQVASDGVAAITLPSGNHLTFGGSIASIIAQPAVGSPVSQLHFPVGLGNVGSFSPAVNPVSGPVESYFGTSPTFVVPEPNSSFLLVLALLCLSCPRRSPRI